MDKPQRAYSEYAAGWREGFFEGFGSCFALVVGGVLIAWLLWSLIGNG